VQDWTTLTAEARTFLDDIETAEATRVSQFNEWTNEATGLEARFNQAISGVTIDSEVIDARNGEVTLKNRLDKEQQEVTAQMAEKVNKSTLPIYLAEYGVSHTQTAATNTPLFKQAVADAQSSGRPLILPWVNAGSWIDINDEILITVGNFKIMGYGKQTRIRQTVFPKAIFKIDAPNVEIVDLFGTGVVFSGAGLGDTHVTNSVVYVTKNGHNTTINRIKGENISTVVNVAGDTVAPVTNVSVNDIESKDVVFALLFSGTRNFNFSNIRGHYKLLNNVATPPHLIYSSNAFGENYNVNGSNCFSKDGEFSYAYQFKNIRGGLFSNMDAVNSKGVLHIMECSNVDVIGVKSLGDTWPTLASGSIELETANANITISKAVVKLAGNGKAVRFSAETSYSKLKDAEIETNHTTENLADDAYDVDIRGLNNTVEDVTSNNIGTARWWASIGIWSGMNHRIVSPKTSGNKDGIIIRFATASGGNLIENYVMSDFKNFTRRAMSIAASTKLIPAEGAGQQNRLLAFDRGDIMTGSVALLSNTTSGHKWEVPFGEFRILNNRIYNSVGVGAVAYLALATSNIELKSGVKYKNREALVVRLIDRTNFIAARLDHFQNLAYIYKVVGGITTTIAQVPFTPKVGRRYEYRLSVFDDQADFIVDGVRLVSTTLDADTMTMFGTAKNHGIIGLAEPEGLFDNIEWVNIE